jgi:hypothetical protein
VNADVLDLTEERHRNALFVLDVLVRTYVPKNTNDWHQGLEALYLLRGAPGVALGDGAERRVEQHVAAARGEVLQHVTKENGDCVHWCKACHAEERERNARIATAGVTKPVHEGVRPPTAESGGKA